MPGNLTVMLICYTCQASFAHLLYMPGKLAGTLTCMVMAVIQCIHLPNPDSSPNRWLCGPWDMTPHDSTGSALTGGYVAQAEKYVDYIKSYQAPPEPQMLGGTANVGRHSE